MPSPSSSFICDHSCPLCHGRGTRLAPYHSDFGPRIVETPCPNSHPVTEVSVWKTFFWMLAVFCLLKWVMS